MPVYLGVNGEVKKINTIQYKNENGIVIEPYKPDAGRAIFTTSGIFTVPEGVKQIDVFCVGGGGAGGANRQSYSNAVGFGQGGGGGYTKTVIGISVTPGDEISVIVGAGTNKSDSNGQSSVCGQGGTSSCKSCSATGGYSGYQNIYGLNSGNGGSGGGKDGMLYYKSSSSPENPYRWNGGGNGGSDGSDGYVCVSTGSVLYDDYLWSQGQGSTTRAFGDLGNTLYAGGGGAGTYGNYSTIYWDNESNIYKWGTVACGGGGGGGKGAAASSNNGIGYNGTDGTGGGGGGGYWTNKTTPSKGGDGIVIIRWGHVG